MKRRSFLIRVGGAIAATPAVMHLAGCGGGEGDGDGGGDPDAGGGGDCSDGAEQGSISANHGHALAPIPVDDINAGADKVYDITGSSLHPHTVTVTAADFSMLAAGMSVSIVSSNDAGHTHTVTIQCA